MTTSYNDNYEDSMIQQHCNQNKNDKQNRITSHDKCDHCCTSLHTIISQKKNVAKVILAMVVMIIIVTNVVHILVVFVVVKSVDKNDGKKNNIFDFI